MLAKTLDKYKLSNSQNFSYSQDQQKFITNEDKTVFLKPSVLEFLCFIFNIIVSFFHIQQESVEESGQECMCYIFGLVRDTDAIIGL